MGLLDDLKKLLEDAEETADEQEEEAPADDTSTNTAEQSNEASEADEDTDARDERIAELESKLESLTAIASYYVKDVDAESGRVNDGKWRPALKRAEKKPETKSDEDTKPDNKVVNWDDDPVAFMDAIDSGEVKMGSN